MRDHSHISWLVYTSSLSFSLLIIFFAIISIVKVVFKAMLAICKVLTKIYYCRQRMQFFDPALSLFLLFVRSDASLRRIL